MYVILSLERACTSCLTRGDLRQQVRVIQTVLLPTPVAPHVWEVRGIRDGEWVALHRVCDPRLVLRILRADLRCGEEFEYNSFDDFRFAEALRRLW